MKTEIKKEQSNMYHIIDSMGRNTGITFMASNMKEAWKIAATKEKELGSSFYRVTRYYATGGGLKAN